MNTHGGIEVLLGSLISHPNWLEHSTWHIVTVHVSCMTQGGIEVLIGSLKDLPIRLEHDEPHDLARVLYLAYSELTCLLDDPG